MGYSRCYDEIVSTIPNQTRCAGDGYSRCYDEIVSTIPNHTRCVGDGLLKML